MGDEAKDEKPDTINLKVVAQDGNEIFFKCACPRRPPAHIQDSVLTRRRARAVQVQEDDAAPEADERVLPAAGCAAAAARRRRAAARTAHPPPPAGVSMRAVRFHFDGERLRETQTPSELDMEDGDAIDVSMEQVEQRGREAQPPASEQAERAAAGV